MPVGKKKSSTTPPHPSTSVPAPAPVESEATVLPTQSDFHRHLRTQVRSVMRDFLQSVLREELDAFIGCQWGEHSQYRQGYRNGYYQRDLATTSGKIEGLKVPREREGQFQTQLFESYHRYEPQVEEGLSALFVAGVSTAKVGQVAQTLMGVAPSKSAVSRLNADLSDQLEEWHKRKLASQWQIIYLDGVYYKVRHGAEAVSMPLVVALGVDQAGHKEVLALRASAEESKAGWQLLLEDLRERGVGQVGVFITDGNEGVLAALAQTYPATPRQRCLLHIQRAVSSAIPKGERGKIWAEISGIWQQPSKEAAENQLAAFKARYAKTYPQALKSLLADESHLFTFYQFEAKWHKFMRTTNAIESLFNNVRTRTDSIEVFTTEESCLAIVWAALMGIRLARLPV